MNVFFKKSLYYIIVLKIQYGIILLNRRDIMKEENNRRINRNAVDNANYIIQYFNKKNQEITYQMLNRLMYLYEAIYMSVTDEDCLFNENFYANSFEIDNEEYQKEYKGYGNLPIEINTKDDYDNGVVNKMVVIALYSLFHKWTLAELISFTTREGSPWDNLKKQNNNIIPKEAKIDKAETRNWFKKMVEIDESK